jgi:hypothetical protein
MINIYIIAAAGRLRPLPPRAFSLPPPPRTSGGPAPQRPPPPARTGRPRGLHGATDRSDHMGQGRPDRGSFRLGRPGPVDRPPGRDGPGGWPRQRDSVHSRMQSGAGLGAKGAGATAHPVCLVELGVCLVASTMGLSCHGRGGVHWRVVCFTICEVARYFAGSYCWPVAKKK